MKDIVQLTGSNKENKILTSKDGLSFFKSVQTKYNRYGTQFNLINHNIDNSNSTKKTFSLKFNGDLLHKCFFEIELPNILFDDTDINNENYIKIKEDKKSKLNTLSTSWKNDYEKIFEYSKKQIEEYNKVSKLINFNNDITITSINDLTIDYNYTFPFYNDKTEFDNNTNIIIYINKNLKITNLNKDTIKNNINERYNNIQKVLKYYYSNYILTLNKISEIENININYKWDDDIGLKYFSKVELKIDNRTFDEYDSDILKVVLSSVTKEYSQENFNNLISNSFTYNKKKIYNNLQTDYSQVFDGNTINVTKFYSNNTNKSQIIYVPLIFWFCLHTENALPLCSLNKKNSESVEILGTIIKNEPLVYFQDYKENFNNLIVIDIPKHDHPNNNKFKFLLDENENNNFIESLELILPEYLYRYKCIGINFKLLHLHFDIDKDISKDIIENYTTNKKWFTQDDWVIFRQKMFKLDINNLPAEEIDIDTLLKITGYDNKYINNYEICIGKLTKNIKIKLITETCVVDDVEKTKLVNNTLDYYVRTYNTVPPRINSIDNPNSEIKLSNINFESITDNIFIISQPIDIISLSNDNNKYHKSYLLKYNNNITSTDNSHVKDLKIIIEPNNHEIDFNEFIFSYYHLRRKLPEGIFFKNFSLFPLELEFSGGTYFKSTNTKCEYTIDNNFFNTIIDFIKKIDKSKNEIKIKTKIISTKIKKLVIEDLNIEILNI